MNENKSMDDKGEQQEAPAIDVTDELADEALDRPFESRHCATATPCGTQAWHPDRPLRHPRRRHAGVVR